MNQQKKLSRKEMRIDFDGKIGAFDRFKQRVFSWRFLGQFIWMILRYVLLIGISYMRLTRAIRYRRCYIKLFFHYIFILSTYFKF